MYTVPQRRGPVRHAALPQRLHIYAVVDNNTQSGTGSSSFHGPSSSQLDSHAHKYERHLNHGVLVANY